MRHRIGGILKPGGKMEAAKCKFPRRHQFFGGKVEFPRFKQEELGAQSVNRDQTLTDSHHEKSINFANFNWP